MAQLESQKVGAETIINNRFIDIAKHAGKRQVEMIRKVIKVITALELEIEILTRQIEVLQFVALQDTKVIPGS